MTMSVAPHDGWPGILHHGEALGPVYRKVIS